jgi:hypothetical protein
MQFCALSKGSERVINTVANFYDIEIHSSSEFYEQRKFIGSSARQFEVAAIPSHPRCLDDEFPSLKIPVNQLVMRKLLDGKSSTASKRKTSLWKCPFVLEFIFHFEFSSRFLSKRSHIFQMLKSE